MPVYRCRGVALLVPLYGGLIAGRIDTWSLHNGNVVSRAVGYSYDSAGRIVREHGPVENIAYTHDSRGNITRISGGLMADSVYTYSGDRLTSFAQAGETSAAFSYDNHGRMTSDGLKGTSFQYNTMDLVAKICSGATTLVNYSYLWNGVKICALKTSGDGLVYRGPFVYRKSSDGNVILESALFEDGRLTTSGVILHVTDHLGSVVAAVRGSDGALYEASQYDAFGKRSSLTEADTVPLPQGIVLRSGFSGKEDQKPEFGAEYMDFGARQYSSMQRRWMTPDPLSEKYYGVSPYTYCDGDPVNFIDPEGKEAKRRINAARKMTGTKYKQEVIDSLRTHFSPIALEYMDCSEFVCRVLYADELSNTVLSLNTKGLYEFLNHSDKFTFSDHPHPGDIALWKGHVGIVSEVSKDDRYKLIHAANPKSGSLENPHFTTSNVYAKDFIGFFRPKTETTDNNKKMIYTAEASIDPAFIYAEFRSLGTTLKSEARPLNTFNPLCHE